MRSDYSASVSRTSQPGSPSPFPTSSKLANTNLDDLPDDVLVEILSRLWCYEFVFQCKLVCELWGKLMSEPHFIGRFVLQQQRKPAKTQRPLPLLKLMSQSGDAHPPLLQRCPFVSGVCNDLVLYCGSPRYTRHYFLCNPYTGTRVDLPHVDGTEYAPVGFICDPFYRKTRHDVHGEAVCINFNYRCKVVSLRPCEGIGKDELSSKLRAEIFSFDTGEWRQSIVSFPRKFSFRRIEAGSYFVHNEMLYWSSTWESGSNFLIGLDPFVISDTHNMTTSSSTSCSDDQESCYRCRFIELGVEEDGDNPFPLYNADHKYKIRCLGVAEGSDCLQTCVYDSSNNTHFVLVWDLKRELITRADGVGKLSLKRYILVDIAKEVEVLSFDPSSEGVMHARLEHGVGGVVSFTQINFGSRSSGMEVDIAGKGSMLLSHVSSGFLSFRICVKSLWPTPIPRLPMREGKSPAEASRSMMKIAQGSGELAPKPSRVQHSNGVHPSGISKEVREMRLTLRLEKEIEQRRQAEEFFKYQTEAKDSEIAVLKQELKLEREKKKQAEEFFNDQIEAKNSEFAIARAQNEAKDSEISMLMNQELKLGREKKTNGQRWIWGVITTALTLGTAALANYHFEACESDDAGK